MWELQKGEASLLSAFLCTRKVTSASTFIIKIISGTCGRCLTLTLLFMVLCCRHFSTKRSRHCCSVIALRDTCGRLVSRLPHIELPSLAPTALGEALHSPVYYCDTCQLCAPSFRHNFSPPCLTRKTMKRTKSRSLPHVPRRLRSPSP